MFCPELAKARLETKNMVRSLIFALPGATKRVAILKFENQRLVKLMNDIVNRMVELAVQIQQIPAPTFHEQKRAEFIQKLFIDEGLKDVCNDETGNVLGCFPGKGQEKPLIVSAHMDTVFPLETDLSVEWGIELIHGPGLGDNSLGVASLFGLLWS
jgi:acetylornithine deacetylase/succinyl-diaminopimelate desuccinylase-like protein